MRRWRPRSPPARCRAELDAGELRIGWNEPDWFGPGRLVVPGSPPNLWSAGGHAFSIGADWVHASLSVRSTGAAVLGLRLEAHEQRERARDRRVRHARRSRGTSIPRAAPTAARPTGCARSGHQYTEFALPVFSDAALSRWRLLPFRPAVVMPLGLVAPDGRTILLAPLRGVPRAGDRGARGQGAGRRRACGPGWHGDIDDGRRRLRHRARDHRRRRRARLLRRAGRGCSRRDSGVEPPPRDRDVLGTRLSYWTDNGSAYWYRTEGGLDAASTVVAAVDDLEQRGVPGGRGAARLVVVPARGAAPVRHRRVGRAADRDGPLGAARRRAPRRHRGRCASGSAGGRSSTHCRHLSSQSPYCDEFAMWIDGDRAHPQDAELYERLLDQCVAWGVEVFEHDWLIECFLGVRGLARAGPGRRVAGGHRRRARGARPDAQWCMASPADFAQATPARATSRRSARAATTATSSGPRCCGPGSCTPT